MKVFLLFFILLPLHILAQTPHSVSENIELQNNLILLEAPENIQELALQESLSGESYKFAKFVESDVSIENKSWEHLDAFQLSC